MDGLPFFLFSIIPIKPFAWACGALWLAVGAAGARSLISRHPSLVLSPDGIEVAGLTIPWSEVTGARALKQNNIAIDVVDAGALLQRHGPLRRLAARINLRTSGTPIVLSSNESGVDQDRLLQRLRLRLLPPPD